MFRTTNGGANWDSLPLVTSSHLFAVFFLDAQLGWIVGNQGRIFKTTNAGATWLPQTSGSPVRSALYAVHFVDPQLGFASGSGGVVLRTTDGGETWNQLTSVTSSILYAIRFATRDIGWVVGGEGTILRTDNGGGPLPLPPEVPLDFDLKQNYPNPFNGGTTIRYRFTSGQQHVQLQVFNLLGQRVATIADETQDPNSSSPNSFYQYRFEASNLATGVYFIRLRVGDLQLVRKMLILR
jgi:hypothetical protein